MIETCSYSMLYLPRMAKLVRTLEYLIEIILGGGLVCYAILAIIGFVLFPNEEPRLQKTMVAAYVLTAAALILGVALIVSGIRHARSRLSVRTGWPRGDDVAIIAKPPFEERPGDNPPSAFAWLLWTLCVLIYSAGIVIWFWRH